MFSNDLALVIVGSLNAKEADRSLPRAALVTVQCVFPTGDVAACRFFDSFGDIGVSSLALSPTEDFVYFSVGTSLARVCLADRSIERVDVGALVDVHEMDFIDGRLHIANTGNDELVVYSPVDDVVERRSLRDIYRGTDASMDASGDVEDRFHLNQVFAGPESELYGLVHHVEGKQLLRRIAARALKSQGNGGCIRLSDGARFPLSLHAPHTVTFVDGGYWVFDSGKALIKIFDENWTLTGQIPTAGWGRGASITTHDGRTLFAAGLSNIRRRYLHLFENADSFINGVEIFDVNARRPIFRKQLDNVEQVNNVYFMPRSVVERLL